MADDDIDYIDDLLDAPFKQQSSKQDKPAQRRRNSDSSDDGVKKSSSSKSDNKIIRRSRSKDRKDRDKDKSSKDESKKDRRDDKKRSRSKERRRKSRSKSRDKRRSRSRSRDKRKRSRSRDRRRDDRDDLRRKDRERDRDRRRSRSRDRRRRSFSPRPFRRGRTPPNSIARSGSSDPEDLAPEERDARTIFCMQLAQRIKARDLEEFFSSVGKVKDVRLITCNKTKRFKGIAYIEFRDPESVALALGLSGQRLLGVPIVVQHTQAEKNRLSQAQNPPSQDPNAIFKNIKGPLRLYVGSIHHQVTEDMLDDIFGPFGEIESIQLIRDESNLNKPSYAFITYKYAEDGKRAMTLDGFPIAETKLKVAYVKDSIDLAPHASLDTDEMDRSGIDLGATGRLQLMCKLAEKTDLEIPQVTAKALMAAAPQLTPQPMEEESQPVATQCFLLINMFDPETETGDSWDQDIRDDVIEECNRHGGVLHIFVDTSSKEGKVYVKCPSKATAVLAVNALHGRWFAGRVIAAAYVPLDRYHQHFPEATKTSKLLVPTRQPID